MTRKSCIPPLLSGKLGCPLEQSRNSHDACLFLAFSYGSTFSSFIFFVRFSDSAKAESFFFWLSCQHLLQYPCTSFLSHTHTFFCFWHMHAHIHRRTCLRHTRTHTLSNAAVVRGHLRSSHVADKRKNFHMGRRGFGPDSLCDRQ